MRLNWLIGGLGALLVLPGCATVVEEVLLGGGSLYGSEVADAYADREIKGGTLLILPFEPQLNRSDQEVVASWFPSQEPDEAFIQIVRNAFAGVWRDASYLDGLAFGAVQQGYPMQRFGAGRMPLHRDGEPYRTDSAFVRVPNAGTSIEHNGRVPEYALFIGEWTLARERSSSVGGGPFTVHRTHYVPYVLWDNLNGAMMMHGIVRESGGQTMLGTPEEADWRGEASDVLEALLLISPLSPDRGDGTAAGDMRRERKLREYREAQRGN